MLSSLINCYNHPQTRFTVVRRRTLCRHPLETPPFPGSTRASRTKFRYPNQLGRPNSLRRNKVSEVTVVFVHETRSPTCGCRHIKLLILRGDESRTWTQQAGPAPGCDHQLDRLDIFIRSSSRSILLPSILELSRNIWQSELLSLASILTTSLPTARTPSDPTYPSPAGFYLPPLNRVGVSVSVSSASQRIASVLQRCPAPASLATPC